MDDTIPSFMLRQTMRSSNNASALIFPFDPSLKHLPPDGFNIFNIHNTMRRGSVITADTLGPPFPYTLPICVACYHSNYTYTQTKSGSIESSIVKALYKCSIAINAYPTSCWTLRCKCLPPFGLFFLQTVPHYKYNFKQMCSRDATLYACVDI